MTTNKIDEAESSILVANKVTSAMSTKLARNLERQKIILEKRQQGLSRKEILEFLHANYPHLISGNYTISGIKMDLYRTLSTLVRDIKPLANSYLVSELVALDQQEEETRNMIDTLQGEFDKALQGGNRPMAIVDRWIKAQQLRLQVSDRRNLLLNVAVPKVDVVEQRTINISLDDYNKAKTQLKNIVKISGQHQGPDEDPPVIVDVDSVEQVQ